MFTLADTRETAFLQAMSAAGGVYSVTSACSSGALPQCTCLQHYSTGQETGEKWEWGGCGDDIRFGRRKVKDFLDLDEDRHRDIRTQIHRHNNEVGRLVSVLVHIENYLTGNRSH